MEQARQINEFVQGEFCRQEATIDDFLICPYHVDGVKKQFSINYLQKTVTWYVN